MKKAIEQVKEELVSFSERLQKINETEQLNVVDIDELLVWNNSNQTWKPMQNKTALDYSTKNFSTQMLNNLQMLPVVWPLQ